MLAACWESTFQASASLGTTQRAIVPPSWSSRRRINTSSLCYSACKVRLSSTVDTIAPVKNGDSVTRISKSFTERVEQARLWTSLGNQCLKAHVASVALAKYVSHLPLEQSSTSYPFRSAIVFGNAMHRSTIVGRETERKPFIDHYCTG